MNLLLLVAVIGAVSADQSAGEKTYRQMLESQGGGSRGGGGGNGGGNGTGNGGNGRGNGRGRNSSNSRDDDRNPPLEGDYLIRFNKVSFLERFGSDTDVLPLRINNFPVRGRTMDVLQRQTNAVSVTNLDDFEVQLDVLDRIENGRFMNGYPTHATSDKNSIFWDKFLEVCEVQLVRMQSPNGPASSIGLPLPYIWEGYTLDMVAEAVRDEYPNIHQATNIARMLGNREVVVDNNIIPRRSDYQFLRGPFMLAHLNTWALATIGPHSFSAKYAVGRSRPEEIAFAISEGEIPSQDLPDSVRGVINDIFDRFDGNLPNATSFTAYSEGSPRHPSWPAMHSAASQTSFWMSVVLDMTPEQLCQARLVDWGVAYARTVAGVHYPDDNIDGLNLGQEVISSLLADYLVFKYDSNKDVVEAKMEQMRYDWSTFDSSDPCPYVSS